MVVSTLASAGLSSWSVSEHADTAMMGTRATCPAKPLAAPGRLASPRTAAVSGSAAKLSLCAADFSSRRLMRCVASRPSSSGMLMSCTFGASNELTTTC